LQIWKSPSGILTVEITSATPEETLESITQGGIILRNIIQTDELTCQASIRRRDYRQLVKLLKRRRDRFRIIQKNGLYWSLKAFYQRPILLFTFLLLLLSSLYLPSRVFFVTVEGNTTIPDRLILSAAEDCGIRFAASRRLVRSERVKNALLSAVPALQWAGVNTAGCNAIISVRERIPEQPEMEKNVVSNLIADRDGYILSTTVTNGTAHVHPGESVTKGQLLISGYTDCGIFIRAARAEGEILAQTNRKLKAVMPETYHVIKSIQEKKGRISMLIGKKRIILWKDSRIYDTGCGRMYEEYFVSLPGGFQLPIGIGIDRYQDYEILEIKLSEEEAQMQLEQFSRNYLTKQMVAGQIIQRKQVFSSQKGRYQLESSHICTEMIGKEQREQIGDIHGERN